MKTVAPKRKSLLSSGEGQFDDYEERFVSLERHQRVVHYYLRRHGKETLAVVGTEKSPRHLNYVVQAAFLEAAGLSSTGELLKWRTRREVLEWLDMFVTEPRTGLGPSSGPEDRTAGKFKKQKSSSTAVGKLPCHPQKSWRGDDECRHLSSIDHQGTTVAAHDFVQVLRRENESVAYVEDLAQTEGEDVMLRVRWLEPTDALHDKQLQLTDSHDEVGLEDVVGPAALLTEAHWDRFSPSLPPTKLQHVFFCRAAPAGPSIQALKGYWTQRHAGTVLGDGVLPGLKPPRKRPADLVPSSPPQLSSASRGGSDLSWGTVPKKKRFVGSYVEDDVESTPPIKKKRRRVPGDPPRRLGRPPKLGSSGAGGLSPKPIHGGTKRVQGSPMTRGFGGFKVGDAVETLCEDSGLRGCWFRGRVIAVAAPRRLKIRYEELEDEEDSTKLEEWVTVSRSSAKDTLDLRALGRSRVRPRPPKQDAPSCFCKGAAIDAWWNDGWWEGLISSEGDKEVEVFFPGEGDSAWFQPGDLRPSREWVEGAWKDVPRLPDVASVVKGESPGRGDDVSRAVAKLDVSPSVKFDEANGGKQELLPSPMDADEKDGKRSVNGQLLGDEHSPGTPTMSETRKGAVLALSSFPREKPSLLRSVSIGLPAVVGGRKLGPSKLGRSSSVSPLLTSDTSPLTPGMTSAVAAGDTPATGEHFDAKSFECLENMDEDEPGVRHPSCGGSKEPKNEPPVGSRLLDGGEQRSVHTPGFDTVPTPVGKERASFASPSPSPSFQGSPLPLVQKWEAPMDALESERKGALASLPICDESSLGKLSASKLAEMDPNSEVSKAACELPRPNIAVKRAETPARASAGQQSCSIDAGPAKSSNPQPILSR